MEADKIQALNDAFPRPFSGGRVMITSDVSTLGHEDQAVIFQLVLTYEDFDTDNDPSGEHNFGTLDFRGQRFLWKVDDYNQFLKFG